MLCARRHYLYEQKLARLLWKIEFSQLKLVYCPGLSFGRLAPPHFASSPAASPYASPSAAASPVCLSACANGGANNGALSYLNRSFAAGSRAGDSLAPSACACADRLSQSSLGGAPLTLAVPERSQWDARASEQQQQQQQYRRPASRIARVLRALPFVSRLAARRRARKEEHAAYEEEMHELRLNSQQADVDASGGAAANSSPPVSRRQPGVRDSLLVPCKM